MTFRERADGVARSVIESLRASPNDAQVKEVADLIEQAIIDVVLDERQRCAGVATAVGTPDADLAHKIAEEIRRADDAMVAGRAAAIR